VSRSRWRRQECRVEDRRCFEDGGNANQGDDQGSDDRRANDAGGAEDHRADDGGANDRSQTDDCVRREGTGHDACGSGRNRCSSADAIHAARLRGRSGTEHCVACGASIARSPTICDCIRSGRKDHCGRRDRAMQGRHVLPLEDAHGRLFAARRRLEVDGQTVAGFVSAKAPNASRRGENSTTDRRCGLAASAIGIIRLEQAGVTSSPQA
jgi:hypothetical protein